MFILDTALIYNRENTVLSMSTGAILTCKKGTLDENTGTRADVDKEFVLLFTVMDENKSWFLDQNIKRFCSDPDGAMKQKTDNNFVKSNKMYSINGRVFGNLEGLDMCVGDNISWHLFGIGTDNDVHSGIANMNDLIQVSKSILIVRLFVSSNPTLSFYRFVSSKYFFLRKLTVWESR